MYINNDEELEHISEIAWILFELGNGNGPTSTFMNNVLNELTDDIVEYEENMED